MNDTLEDSLNAISFQSRFTQDLPGDPETDRVSRPVHGACYSRVKPVLTSGPKLLAHSREMAETLGLSEEACRSELFCRAFTGNEVLPGMDPYAMCYGGHQFGHWAGQLGDGRAINLGEIVGRDSKRWTLQLKGAGPTPYSRRADGFAVLRSSVREFLCSEAMHHLGVPTTRALSLALTGDDVVRDMFYDGHPKPEPGAIVCRVSPSFVRFGSFEIFASRGDLSTMKTLLDYTMQGDFPHLGSPCPESYLEFFREVCQTTATLMVEWMRVGFVHGVMNTDNLSILGLTIDYGPYGWLEDYDPNWTPNTTDANGKRYRFGHQPSIAHWNLYQLANALFPLIDDEDAIRSVLDEYPDAYQRGYQSMMRSKLGLDTHESTDNTLIEDLTSLLHAVETDMTIFFRRLADVPMSMDTSSGDPTKGLEDSFYDPKSLSANYRERLQSWLVRYRDRLRSEGLEDPDRKTRMNSVNPKYVLRNYLAQLAIDKAEKGDSSMIVELLDVLRRPYDEQPGKETLAEKRPEWARHRAGCSMLSCSS